jgi:hypothetical protein
MSITPTESFYTAESYDYSEEYSSGETKIIFNTISLFTPEYRRPTPVPSVIYCYKGKSASKIAMATARLSHMNRPKYYPGADTYKVPRFESATTPPPPPPHRRRALPLDYTDSPEAKLIKEESKEAVNGPPPNRSLAIRRMLEQKTKENFRHHRRTSNGDFSFLLAARP